MSHYRFHFFFFTFFSLLISSGLLAQQSANKGGIRKTCTIYHYSFIGAHSLQEVDSLSAEIYKIPEVTEFKASFKPGNQHAEIMLVVVEKFPEAESRSSFSVIRLKDIILSHGYGPLDLTYYCPD